MTRFGGFSSWPAALVSAIGLAGCAAETEYSTLSTSPVTMVCDGGKTFTVSYANGFETAIVETDGEQRELPRVRTAFSVSPDPPGVGARAVARPLHESPGADRFDDREEFGPRRGAVVVPGTTGVRYGDDEALFISRNRQAVLQIGDEIYSNCDVART
jgi:hypothetical protein